MLYEREIQAVTKKGGGLGESSAELIIFFFFFVSDTSRNVILTRSHDASI